MQSNQPTPLVSQFLGKYGDALLKDCPEAGKPQAARFADPQHQPKGDTTLSTAVMTAALKHCLERAMTAAATDPAIAGSQRLELFVELQSRAAQIANGPKSTALSDDVVDLLNILMHDLRSPLVTIRGYVEMMIRGNLGPMTPIQERSMRVALRNSITLDDQIDTFLDYIRLEQGRTIIARKPVLVSKLVQRTREALEELAERKGLDFNVVTPQDEDFEIVGDLDKLRRILRSLLDNAIKFTEEGHITLSITPMGDNVEISVADSGIGVEEHIKARIFEPFFQADPDTRGPGLGLAVSKTLVEAHQSTLRVSNNADGGATFAFTVSAVD